MNGNAVEVIVGVNNAVRHEGGFELYEDKVVRVVVPCECRKDDISKLKKDCHILLELADKYPEEMSSLFQHVSEGNLARAQGVAKKLNLSEEDFIKKGGGLLWLAIPVAVGIFLYPSKAH